jgi:1-acyl-sn-glycerol-3-phosphate acyltransferase
VAGAAAVATRRRGGVATEPWYHVCTTVGLPLPKLWFTWRFEDLEHIPASGPAIVAATHISYLDPFSTALAIIRRGRRPRFLAKDELFRIPLVGRALRGAGQIAVARGTGDRRPLQAAEVALARGEVIAVYPEGTVTKRRDHLPKEGKTGAVRLALATGVPIVPLASWGSQAVWQKSGRGSLKFGRPVWVQAGPPIDLSARAGELADPEAVRAMTDDLMAVLTDMAERLRERYPKRWAVG